MIERNIDRPNNFHVFAQDNKLLSQKVKLLGIIDSVTYKLMLPLIFYLRRVCLFFILQHA